MGPPREHGGMSQRMSPLLFNLWQLQWGRRVNTAEWPISSLLAISRVRGFNGAAA